MRRSGQTSLLLSFSKSRVAAEDRATVCSNKPSVSFSEYLNRKVTKTSSRSVKEKKTCFASIVPANDDLTSKRVGDCDSFVLHDQIFRQFKVSEKKEEPGEIAELGETIDYQPESSFGGGEVSRKRKKAFDDPSASSRKKTTRKSLVVIGDDSKPWSYGRQKKIMDSSTKPLYDHCKLTLFLPSKQMQMAVEVGIATGKVSIPKKLAAMKYGKELDRPPWEVWNGIDQTLKSMLKLDEACYLLHFFIDDTLIE